MARKTEKGGKFRQSNVKEEKHLFENLTIKALEKYRK